HTAAIRVAGRIGSEVFVIEIRKSPSSTDPDVAELYMAVKVPRPFKWVRADATGDDDVVDGPHSIACVGIIIACGLDLSVVNAGHASGVVVALVASEEADLKKQRQDNN